MAGDLTKKFGDYLPTQRVPVLYADGTPAMPTKVYRAKRWIKNKKAKIVKNNLNILCVQLLDDTKFKNHQKISVGIDPGKYYSGIGIQTARNTILGIHVKLPVLNSKKSKKINTRSRKIPSEIKESRTFEFLIAKEINSILPITNYYLEISRTKKPKEEWNGSIWGEYWLSKELSKLAETSTIDGTTTSIIRKKMSLHKQKTGKGECKPETQVVDGIALASGAFRRGKRKRTHYYAKVNTGIFSIVCKNIGPKNKREKSCFNSNINKKVDYKTILSESNFLRDRL